jgi:Zn-finger protein
VLGKKCGGDFVYREDGVKDCTACLYPHLRENYGEIVDRYREILAAIREKE